MCLLTTNNRVRLLDNLLALGQDQLDVARVGHVGVDLSFVSILYDIILYGRKGTYTTVGTVGSSSLLGSLVDLDVLDD